MMSTAKNPDTSGTGHNRVAVPALRLAAWNITGNATG